MKILLLALIALGLIDGLLTHFLITRGYGVEANPLLRPLMGKSGFLPTKIVLTVFAAAMLYHAYHSLPTAATIIAICFVSLYSVICLWNTSMFFR